MARNTREAKLILSVVDQITGPSRRALRSLTALRRGMDGLRSADLGRGVPGNGARAGVAAARSYAEAYDRETSRHDRDRRSRGDAAGVAAGIGIAGSLAGRTAYETERKLNEATAAGNLSLEDRARVERNAIALNYKYGGSVNDVIAAHTELLRSGLSLEESFMALPNVMNLSQATGEGTIDVARAIVTNLTALRQEMQASARAADLFVQALDRTAGLTLKDFEVSGKYWNPVAAMTGFSPEEAMAMQVEFAKRGIYGSSAGTGLRAGPAAILSPSKKGLAAMARFGIDPRDYIGPRSGEASAEQILAALEARGLETNEEMTATVAGIIKRNRTDAQRSKAIIATFADELGIVTAEDRSATYEALVSAFAAGSAKVDLPRLLRDANARGAGVPFFNDLFGKNHGSKWAGFVFGTFEEELNQILTNAFGSADRKSATMMYGIVGQMNELEGATQSLINAFKNSGLLADAARSMNGLARAADAMSKLNPAILRFGALAALGLAAAVPLGFALSGIGAAAAFATSPIVLVGGALGALAAANLEPLTEALAVFGKSARIAFSPEVVGMARRARDAVGSLLDRTVIDPAAYDRLGQVARNMGLGFAGGVNAAAAAIPSLDEIRAGVDRLRAIGGQLAAMGQEAWAGALPKISEGLESLRSAIVGMASAKLDAFRTLADSLVAFAERVLPVFKPAAFAGFDMVATSFNTLAAGAQAVGQFLSTAQDAIVAFATAFVNNIDTAAMQSIANGLKTVFDTIAAPVRMLGDAFKSVSGYLSATKADLAAFASGAGAAVGEGFNAIVTALVNLGPRIDAAWQTVKSVLSAIGAYVPDFSTIIQTVQNFASAIARAAEAVAGAVQKMRDAVANMPSLNGALQGGPGGRASDLGAQIGSMVPPPPRRAAGGLVRAGRTYLVGERGPELATFGRQGQVTPNHKLGGGPTIHFAGGINVYAPTREGNDIVAAIREQLTRSPQTSFAGGRF